MTPIDPMEISALIDGELSPSRAREVTAAIEQNPELRAEFDRLRLLHEACSQAAATATFTPREINVSANLAKRTPLLPLLAGVALLAVRFLPKALDLGIAGPLLHAAALAGVLLLVIRLVNRQRAQESLCFDAMPV